MQHPMTTIRYIDLDTQKGEVICLSMFCLYMKKNPGHKILVQEGYGWTELQDISAMKIKDGEQPWIGLRIEDDRELVISKAQMIAVWDPSMVSTGFHGRALYAFHLIQARDLKPGDILRFLPGDDGSTFRKVLSIRTYTNGPFMAGYHLSTESGFFAGNNIQLDGCKWHDFDMHWA